MYIAIIFIQSAIIVYLAAEVESRGKLADHWHYKYIKDRIGANARVYNNRNNCG